MDDIVKKVETFLAFSEEKLDELKTKNQALKEELDPQKNI
ncbi:SP_0009 family protein [Streptococcus bovimastitidis]|nr:SP_0009 family protein [Streptococcus bovimastitidis]